MPRGQRLSMKRLRHTAYAARHVMRGAAAKACALSLQSTRARCDLQEQHAEMGQRGLGVRKTPPPSTVGAAKPTS